MQKLNFAFAGGVIVSKLHNFSAQVEDIYISLGEIITRSLYIKNFQPFCVRNDFYSRISVVKFDTLNPIVRSDCFRTIFITFDKNERKKDRKKKREKCKEYRISVTTKILERKIYANKRKVVKDPFLLFITISKR